MQQRRIVRDTIVDHATFRSSRVLALNVRTNHVHLVLASAAPDPGDLAGRFKARATRALRDAGLAGPDAVWTSRSSTRYLWDAASIEAAIRYVLDEQGPRDEFVVPGEPF
jgi:REP element-mobilizing transposase RayT